jgi:DNA replicative helicase MCM subunit Mcm2 (Cdc46/Mcm family)
MNIISIDIGEKNFAYSFIKVTVLGGTVEDGGTKCVTSPRCPIKEATSCIFEVEEVYLYNAIEKPKQTIVESCCKISKLLCAHDMKISTCMYILIEQQMRPNIRAQRIAQHVWSYLHTKYILRDDSKVQRQIVSVSSSLKTKIFTEETLDKNHRKKWVTNAVLTKNIVSLAKAHNILVDISDDILETIRKMIKQDDVCDTIVQSLVFLIKNPKLIKNLR